jgi:hypothetical protein
MRHNAVKTGAKLTHSTVFKPSMHARRLSSLAYLRKHGSNHAHSEASSGRAEVINAGFVHANGVAIHFEVFSATAASGYHSGIFCF